MRSFVLALLLVALAGCGGEGRKIPVSGKILLDGKPIKVEKPQAAAVNFHPDGAKGNEQAETPVATVDADGQYTLTTNGKPGAPPGWYKVTVSYTTPTKPKDEYSPRNSLVSPSFSSATSTPLRVEVKDGAAAGAYDLKVTK